MKKVKIYKRRYGISMNKSMISPFFSYIHVISLIKYYLLTVGNGKEFSDSQGMEKALYRIGNRTKICYCHPRSPEERGSNENANTLICN